MSKKPHPITEKPEVQGWQQAMNLVPDTLVWIDTVDGKGLRGTIETTVLRSIESGPEVVAVVIMAGVDDRVMIPWHNVAAITPVKRKSA